MKSKDVGRVLLSKRAIEKRVKGLAKELDNYYRGDSPLAVCVLKGSVVFFADLLRAMQTPVRIEFIQASSYREGTVSGELKITKDLGVDVAGKEVLIVEDIIDSGNTLFRLKELLVERGAKVKIVTLLDKPARREAEIAPDFKGFTIADEFVVGYGLDYAEDYRDLPYIGVLKGEVYTK